MPMMSGARFLAETLHAYGVTHYFFMPVSVPEAMPELERLGLRPVMAHTEKGAAYMADGFARISGGAGVCGAQSVGALNLAAGLQDAYLACSPVLALTGRLTQIMQNRHAYQEVDHSAPFAAVTKFATPVTSIAEFPIFLRQALREVVSGTPGPAHLDLWGITGGEIMNAEASLDVIVEEPFRRAPPFRPEPDTASVRAALAELAGAERPVIVAGGGVRSAGARAELIELAERLNIPVITSLNAKETFPADHPLAVGVSGTYSRECANRVFAEVDLGLLRWQPQGRAGHQHMEVSASRRSDRPTRHKPRRARPLVPYQRRPPGRRPRRAPQASGSSRIRLHDPTGVAQFVGRARPVVGRHLASPGRPAPHFRPGPHAP